MRFSGSEGPERHLGVPLERRAEAREDASLRERESQSPSGGGRAPEIGAASEDGGRIGPFLYPMRIVGSLTLVAIVVLARGEQGGLQGFHRLLIGIALVYPHLSRWLATKLARPRPVELGTSLVDDFLLGATIYTPRCDDINLRKGPSTSYAIKTRVDRGAQITVVTTVSGGSYATTCGSYVKGSSWYRITAINGRSITSLYGRTYLYAASKLFRTVTAPTAAPTTAPAQVTAAPTDVLATDAPPKTASATEAPTTTVSPKCDGVNFRTGPSTRYTKKTSVTRTKTGTRMTSEYFRM